jgi:hypothetical protein
MRRCASWGRTGLGLASGRSVRPGFISLVWPKEAQEDHVRNAKLSLAQPLTWPAGESVRTLPCHRPAAQNQSGVRCFHAYLPILSSIRTGCCTQSEGLIMSLSHNQSTTPGRSFDLNACLQTILRRDTLEGPPRDPPAREMRQSLLLHRGISMRCSHRVPKPIFTSIRRMRSSPRSRNTFARRCLRNAGGHDGRSDVVVHRLGDDPRSSRHAPRLENPYPGDLLWSGQSVLAGTCL